MSTEHKSVRRFRAMAVLVALTMCLTLVGTHISTAAPVRDEFTNYTSKISNEVMLDTTNGQ